MDRVHTIRLCFSLSGGTGSGLGTRLLSEISDMLPSASVTAVAISPFSSETPTQSLNYCLAVDQVARAAGSCAVFCNDTEGHLAGSGAGMAAINARITGALRHLEDLEYAGAGYVLEDTVSFPSAMFFGLGAGLSLPSALKPITEEFTPGSRTIRALVASTRGDGPPSRAELDLMGKSLKPVSWNGNLWLTTAKLRGGGGSGSGGGGGAVVVCANSTSIQKNLRSMVEKADALVEAGAYLHWFERYNVEKDWVCEAIDNIAEIHDTYAELARE